MHAHRIQIQNTEYRIQQYTYMQHIQDNTEQENREQYTEQHTETDTNNLAENSTQDNAQPQRTVMHTYSYDLYHEYVAIKNSNTIELYTISKENI